MNSWWEAFWFFLPAGIANMAPVLANKISRLNDWKTPLDFGKSIGGTRIFGDNKTCRGVCFGVFLAVLTGLFQYRFIASSPESTGFIILVSGAMGFGALLGDALESLVKRRMGIPAGEKWVPFDQTDYIIGGLLAAYIFLPLTGHQIIMIFIIYFGLHLLFSYIGYHLGFKKKPI